MLLNKSLLSILLLLLSACAGSGNDGMANENGVLRSLVSAQDCGGSSQQPSLKLLRTQHQISAIMSRLAVITGDNSVKQYSIVAQDDMLLQIEMGRQTTGGYALRLIEDEFVIEDGWANIKVQWITPAQGMMTTQVLTSPCLLVAIPKREYEGIRVLDQAGKIRLQTSL